ncbi:Peptide methionine sulfoxide reductase MsrA [Halalkalibacter krulwichiae]|uniref:peptide-methionine (S)-S-oxide reductase n=1 Tax=Halalkalibacter krulwichiae TaxID=199441 RepID=A0A1X9MAM9_9BACI|nr:Peptide methionine sulfoxide reductase MsrA [Halalkalibacter krulwichiae]
MQNPIYRQMGDHTETIEIDFDSSVLKLEELFDIFWQSHNALKVNHYRGKQYQSMILFRNDEQAQVALASKRKWEDKLNGTIQTEIAPLITFYLAEERHQKYYLKRFPKAYFELMSYFPTFCEFVDSTLVARLNGFVREYGSLQSIKMELAEWPLRQKEKGAIESMIQSLKW